MPDIHDQRALLLAPTGRDANLLEHLLREAGVEVTVCESFEAMLACMNEGAGTAIIAEEGLPPVARAALVDWIETQPTWADLPLIFLTFAHSQRAEGVFTALGPRANLRLLERPVGAAVLLAAVRSAVRERSRQYEVRSLLEELESADRRKDDFMALLGHELRTPLAAIKTAAQLLQRKASDPSLERMSGLIDKQIDTIGRLIDDLLEISRVARGKIGVEREWIDLRALVAEHVGGLRARSDARGRKVAVTLPRQPLFAFVDPLRIEQVISNLFTNALKYTPPPGRIEVELARVGDEAVLRIRDEGIGIEAEMLPRIFDAFTQVEEARKMARGGLGLGLPLVRSLVELHGGSVEAHSEGLGKGSEFVVRLPLEEEEPEGVAEAEAQVGRSGSPAPAEQPDTPARARIFSSGQKPVKLDWKRLRPTKAVKSRKAGLTHQPSASETRMKMPARRRMILSSHI